MGMFRTLKHRLRRMLIPPQLLSDMESVRLSQGKILAALNRDKPISQLADCEFRIFSQFGEDGIIQRLLASVPIANRTFIEFGVEDFSESNCRFLMMNNNWSGFVVDASSQWIGSLRKASWWTRFDLRATCSMLNRENINATLLTSEFAEDLGLLSIDVDGIDYWLWESTTAYHPRILIVEYNALLGPDRAITVPYRADFSRRQAHFSELYFGASLAALTVLAERKGYTLVGTESSGVNAFFVRNDVRGDIPALSVRDAFHACKVRQSRGQDGTLNYLPPDACYTEIIGLPVINVHTGEQETL